MMAPTFLEWGKWLALMTIIGTVVPAMAGVFALRCRSGSVLQSIWRSAFVLLLVLALGETAGLFRGLGDWVSKGETVVTGWRVSHANPVLEKPGDEAVLGLFTVVETQVDPSPARWYERQSWLPGVVLFGGMGLGVFFCVGLRLVLAGYLGRHRLPISEKGWECFRVAKRRLDYGGSCRLFLSSGKLGPMAFGAFRPTVVIPSPMIEEFSDDELKLVYAHELAHLKNRDPWWQPLVAAGTLLYWWHPMVWWARRNLLISGEFAADSRAVNADFSPVSLAECLVKFGRRVWAINRSSLLFQNGAAFESALGKRVERLVKGRALGTEPTRVRRLGMSSGSGIVMVCVYLAVSRIGFPGMADGNLVAEVFGSEEGLTESAEVADLGSDSVEAPEPIAPVATPVPFLGDVPTVTADRDELLDSSEEVESSPDPVVGELIESPEVTAVDEKHESSDRFLTRRFRVDPESIKRALEEFGGDEDGVQAKLSGLFRRVAPSIAGPSSTASAQSTGVVFYNEENDMLLVRVLESEADAVEELVAFFSVSPVQVVLKFDIMELNDDANEVLTEHLPGFGGLESGVTEGMPHAILSESAFEALTESLVQQAGCDVLGSPSITTLSGRPAELRATESLSIVFPREFQESPEGTPLFPEGDLSATLEPKGTQVTAREVRIGPTTHVLPMVRHTPEGFEIDLDVAFLIREFMGYDDPGPFTVNWSEESPKEVMPLPRFRQSETKTRATIQDGQTLALKGMSSTNVRKMKSKVPVLGSLPLLGRLFRSERTETMESHLVIFVTAMVIDPAGNRIRTK